MHARVRACVGVCVDGEEWEGDSEKNFDTTCSNSFELFVKTSTRRVSVASFSFSTQGRVTLKELFRNWLKALVNI
jgi:hypothetical protein